MVQKINKLSLKINDQGLTGGMYRNERDHSSGNFHPPTTPYLPLPHQPPPTQPPPHQPLQNQPPSRQPSPYQPPPYQSPPRCPLRNFQYEGLSDEKELNNLFYQEDDFEEGAYDGGMAYGRGHRRITNPNPYRVEGFFFLIMKGEETTQVIMNIG